MKSPPSGEKPPPVNRGVVMGRFQVVHNDHVKILRAARPLCHHLIVAVRDPDPILGRGSTTTPDEDFHAKNPLTFFERSRVLRAVLAELDFEPAGYSIIPFPWERPELHTYYVPRDAVFFVPVNDERDEEILASLKAFGFEARQLWKRALTKRGPGSAEILRRMVASEPWEHLVPRATLSVFRKTGLLERMKT